MINKIYIDLDETLIHSIPQRIDSKKANIFLDGEAFYTQIHPYAIHLLRFFSYLMQDEEHLGWADVNLITVATKDYAQVINRKFRFGFNDKQIIAREEINKRERLIPLAYNTFLDYDLIDDADPNNILIDNLPPKHNESKMKILGIDESRYIQVDDFYGEDTGWKYGDIKKQITKLYSCS